MKTYYSTTKPMQRKSAYERGFTLLETLIALAVTAVLLGIALPNLTEYSSSRAVRSKATALSGALRLARAEAIRRGNRVTVCPSVNPDSPAPTCAGGNEWNTGWLVFEDVGADGNFNPPNDQLVRVQNQFTDPGTITSAGGGAVTFFPNGVSIGGQRNFLLSTSQTTSANAEHFARRICQTVSGSTRVKKHAESC